MSDMLEVTDKGKKVDFEFIIIYADRTVHSLSMLCYLLNSTIQPDVASQQCYHNIEPPGLVG